MALLLIRTSCEASATVAAFRLQLTAGSVLPVALFCFSWIEGDGDAAIDLAQEEYEQWMAADA